MRFFKKLDKLRQEYKSAMLYSGLNEKQLNGTIKPFDDEFYATLDGKYYNGIPVYYYLLRMSMGKCYDASAILGLAMGDCKICRGNLNKAPTSHGNRFGHGWVEKDGLVYDTTWQIITDKHTYYKLFGATGVVARDSAEFFKLNKGLSTWEIHNREYYEKKYNPMDALLIFQVEQIEKLHLESPVSPMSTIKDKEIAKKVLGDLPKVPLRSSLKEIEEASQFANS